MGVVLSEDCVMRKDGTFVCWDRSAQKCYALKKTDLTADDLTKEEWLELVKVISKPREAERKD